MRQCDECEANTEGESVHAIIKVLLLLCRQWIAGHARAAERADDRFAARQQDERRDDDSCEHGPHFRILRLSGDVS